MDFGGKDYSSLQMSARSRQKVRPHSSKQVVLLTGLCQLWGVGEDQEFNAILGFVPSLRPVWAIRKPVLIKQNETSFF